MIKQKPSLEEPSSSSNEESFNDLEDEEMNASEDELPDDIYSSSDETSDDEDGLMEVEKKSQKLLTKAKQDK